MTQLDDELRPAVAALLTDFGQAMTLEQDTSGTYTASTGKVTGQTTSQTAVLGSPPAPVRRAAVDGVTVLASDLSTWLAAQGLAVTPAVKNRLVIQGHKYAVLRVDTYWSGAQVAAYECFVRSAA